MSFQAANLRSQSVPVVEEQSVADGEAFWGGALLIKNEYSEYQEVAPNDYDAYQGPVEGIALARYGVDGTYPYVGAPSFDILGGLGFPPGKMQALVTHQGNAEIHYSAEYAGTLPAVPGGEYGVVRGADGQWRVNFADTATPLVKLQDITWAQEPLNRGRVVVSLLADPTAY